MSKSRRNSRGGSVEEQYRRCMIELHARMNRGLKEADLSERQRRQYRKSTKEVMARMSLDAVIRLHANVKEFKYYPSHEALKTGVLSKYPSLRATFASPTKKIRGMFDKDGTLHLDGGGTMFQDMPAKSVAEFHAHEMTHALDENLGRVFSGTRRWQQVWKQEIQGHPDYSSHAHRYAHEAFAEAGQQIYGSGKSGSAIARECPQVVLFFQKHKLL